MTLDEADVSDTEVFGLIRSTVKRISRNHKLGKRKNLPLCLTKYYANWVSGGITPHIL
jgi:hypothetical protein